MDAAAHAQALACIAIDAGANVDLTYEAGGDVRVSIYPREPPAEPEVITVTLNCDTSELEEEIRKMHADVNSRLEDGARPTKHRFRL